MQILLGIKKLFFIKVVILSMKSKSEKFKKDRGENNEEREPINCYS